VQETQPTDKNGEVIKVRKAPDAERPELQVFKPRSRAVALCSRSKPGSITILTHLRLITAVSTTKPRAVAY